MATVETATDATPTRLAPDSEFLGATGPAPSLVKKFNGWNRKNLLLCFNMNIN